MLYLNTISVLGRHSINPTQNQVVRIATLNMTNGMPIHKVSYLYLDVYKRQVCVCVCVQQLEHIVRDSTDKLWTNLVEIHTELYESHANDKIIYQHTIVIL